MLKEIELETKMADIADQRCPQGHGTIPFLLSHTRPRPQPLQPRDAPSFSFSMLENDHVNMIIPLSYSHS